MRRHWMMAIVLAGPLGCDDTEDSIDDFDLDAEQALGEHAAPAAGSSDLTTFAHTEDYPGFHVGIEVDGDDVVLDWSNVGSLGITAVWRSTNPTSLLGVLSTTTSTRLMLRIGGSPTFRDVGAASRTQETPTYYYRVVTGVLLSTMVAKVTTPASPGYTKLGLCMLDLPANASDIVEALGPTAERVHVWDPAAQTWNWWSAGDDLSGDLALPFGGVTSILFSDEVPAYLSLAGRVPTNEPSQVVPTVGLNIPSHRLLAAPTTASEVLDEPGVVGVGYWDPPTQLQYWYYGDEGDVDFDITPCMSHYVLRD